MADLNKLKGLLKNDAAKARVQRLNKQGKEAIQGSADGDEKLAAYKKYVDRFYELKEQFPHWEERLDKPIEYSRFVLDYNEEMYKTITAASVDFRGKSPIEVYTLKMHGINLRSIDVLREKYGLNDESIITDYGAGTGKFANLILPYINKLYFVEPNK